MFNMDIFHRLYLIAGILDFMVTIFMYLMLQNTPLIFASAIPTILLLVTFIPIQRMVNQITKKIKEQNGKCYNCNQVMDEMTATLEDNGHVYCHSCDRAIFPNKYYQGTDGIWYKRDNDTSKDGSERT